jgi:LacI family transcriptional regulator
MAIIRKGFGSPTIKDVALEAEVSISTVSRVINRKGGVSEELKNRINTTIDRLRYRPNIVARSLKAKNTKIIGLIIPSIENPIFPTLVKVIESTAQQYGFSTILCNSDGILENEARYLELLVGQQVDGIILDAIGTSQHGYDIVRESNTPLIVLGKAIEGFPATRVTINNFMGAYMAVEHLIRIGMRKIAFIYGHLEATSAIEDRLGGYRKCLDDHGIAFNPDLLVKDNGTFAGGAYATQILLDQSISFDSIFASNDIMAIGSIGRLQDQNLKVPEDISVIGYDDIPISAIFSPHLSTVKPPIMEFGREAVKAILRIVFQKKDLLQEKVFDPVLLIRQSTRPIGVVRPYED